LDVVEMDAASNRGVDDARELRESAMYAASQAGHHKVYIVDEAHMLTREAWNALLKILEEPPPRVVFVFATTDPQKIAQAAAPVLSRLQRFDLKRIGASEIIKRLETVLGSENIDAAPDALAMIARAADGSMRDALSLADQVISIGEGPMTSSRVREALGLVAEDEYLSVVELIAEHRAGEIFDTITRLADSGVDFAVFLSGLSDMLRAQLAVVLNGKADGITPSALDALAAHRDQFSPGDLLRMLSLLSGIEPQFRRSSQQQLLVEMLLVRFALLDRSISLEEVLQGLGGPAATPASRPPASSERPAVRARPAQTLARAAEPPAASPEPPPSLSEAPANSPDWKSEFDRSEKSPAKA
ncbi:MAG: DNA polymerase III subunit gamma/tau, partial [Thermoanaerobaculia bacterium]